MDSTFYSLATTLVMCLLLSSLTEENEAFPVKIFEKAERNVTNRVVKFANEAELEKEINQTFPEMLRMSNMNPYEYLRQKGLNVTGLEIFSFLFQKKLTGKRNKRSFSVKTRGTDASCPVTWILNIEEGRQPREIQRAKCNEEGTMCISADGKPACEEVLERRRIYKYLGKDGNGNDFYQWEYISIPVACTCSA